jgi:hypothetical protein
MHARWTPLVSADSSTPAPALYGHSLSCIDDLDAPYVVCFGGTGGEGVNSQVLPHRIAAIQLNVW